MSQVQLVLRITLQEGSDHEVETVELQNADGQWELVELADEDERACRAGYCPIVINGKQRCIRCS